MNIWKLHRALIKHADSKRGLCWAAASPGKGVAPTRAPWPDPGYLVVPRGAQAEHPTRAERGPTQFKAEGGYVPPATASPTASFVFLTGFSTICAGRPSLHLQGIGAALFEDLIK